MRFTFQIIIVAAVVICLERVISVALKGDLFKPGALKQAFHEVGKTVWLGMKLFVVLWILYLLLIYWVQHKR